MFAGPSGSSSDQLASNHGTKLRRRFPTGVDFRFVVSQSVFRRPGGCSGELEPDPIPNSAVKLPSADGTKSQDLEE
jgi:hypothetical protein